MTSSNQEEKLCRYPSNDDPINLSISKKNKNKSRISFRPHKKNKNYYPWLVFLFLFVVGWLPLWGGRDDAGPCTRFLRRLRWDCDNWTRRKIFASEDCRNPSRVWRRDRRRLVWRPCIYKKLDVSSEKTVILPWMTHAPWGNFSFWHRLWLYDADVSDPSWIPWRWCLVFPSLDKRVEIVATVFVCYFKWISKWILSPGINFEMFTTECERRLRICSDRPAMFYRRPYT